MVNWTVIYFWRYQMWRRLRQPWNDKTDQNIEIYCGVQFLGLQLTTPPSPPPFSISKFFLFLFHKIQFEFNHRRNIRLAFWEWSHDLNFDHLLDKTWLCCGIDTHYKAYYLGYRTRQWEHCRSQNAKLQNHI